MKQYIHWRLVPLSHDTGEEKANNLAGEKSPYLQQHMHNPVDWYPWCDEAFTRAAKENKPVFLSIGYATCHWCHVMAHESFENRKIADILNTGFIAVKVDREERPDIDSVYMAACQQMTGQGGWPLTIIMTPDKKPFFAGTYLPPVSRGGMTGLDRLLRQVRELWERQEEVLRSSAGRFTEHMEHAVSLPPGTVAGPELLHEAYRELAGSFDPVNGGFGRAPRFPTPTNLLFLLRYWKRFGEQHALDMVTQTLDALLSGGIHDQIGGGFHRYSTDVHWLGVHFEKMLYDQALLLMAYTEAWQATKNPAFRAVAQDIIAYVERDLRSPEGAFFSAEDADSNGGEGAFYVWTRAELDAVLGLEDGAFAAKVFGVRDTGNFPKESSGAPGTNVLTLNTTLLGGPEEKNRLSRIRAALLAVRSKRPRPLRDTKILTDWNGLMAAALGQASRVFGKPEYARMANDALKYILASHKDPDGGLFHSSCDGVPSVPGFADDFACIIRALIDQYQTTFDPVWLGHALRLDRYLDGHFSDPINGGFFTTSDRGEQLIVRKMEIYDGAIPSVNSLELENLVLLFHLTGDPSFAERASALADRFATIVRHSPSAYTAYCCGLDHHLLTATDIVITGEGTDPEVLEMVRVIRERYLPCLTVHLRTERSEENGLASMAPFLTAMVPQQGRASAYVCTGPQCQKPVNGATALAEELEKW